MEKTIYSTKAEATQEAKEDKVTKKVASPTLTRPDVFAFSDYRDFLKAMYLYKKALNPSFSENAFIFAAGFGKNSRGYLGLVIKGKRNLTSKSIIGFSQCMQLTSQEAIYFENMVLFNQASTEKEKVYFFERMKVGATGAKSKTVDILSSQYRYLNEWHLVAIREMICLKDFKESPEWIVKKLKNKITKEKAEEGLKDLENLGLITRSEDGELTHSEPVVLFKDNSNNFKNSSNLHKEFCHKAAQEIIESLYEDRAAQLITLSVSKSRFEELRAEMQAFTELILKKYGNSEKENNDTIIQMGSQLIKLT